MAVGAVVGKEIALVSMSRFSIFFHQSLLTMELRRSMGLVTISMVV